MVIAVIWQTGCSTEQFFKPVDPGFLKRALHACPCPRAARIGIAESLCRSNASDCPFGFVHYLAGPPNTEELGFCQGQEQITPQCVCEGAGVHQCGVPISEHSDEVGIACGELLQCYRTRLVALRFVREHVLCLDPTVAAGEAVRDCRLLKQTYEVGT